MAIVLDERILAACQHRRCHGHDDCLLLRVERMRGRAGALAGSPEILRVTWMPRNLQVDTLVAWPVGNVTVYVDRRVARYASMCDITISAWHVGPISEPEVDHTVIDAMKTWERAHSKPEGQPTA
jgi:hypothetical protein